jgi:hypothetical protein
LADPDYARAWANYKRRRLIAWLVPPALLLLSWGATNMGMTQVPIALFITGVLAWLGLQNWYERWPCPRCGKRFNEPGKVNASCASCGLDKVQ